MNGALRSILRIAGKDDKKIAAVFGLTPQECHTAVLHLRSGAAEVPIWLFSTQPVAEETAAQCEQVRIRRDSLALVLEAQWRLWPHWVAIAVTTWTGGHGNWAVKLAPFFIPPFRALILNENGDFLRATPSGVVRHAVRRTRDILHSGWHTAQDVGRGCWKLVSYHVWRSGPVTRVKDEVAGISLLAATLGLRAVSAISGWCGYPYQTVFHRLHGTAPIHPGLDKGETPSGPLVARFRATARVWNGRKFEAFLLASDAPWILWEDDQAEPADDFLAPCANPNTFAVSRQQHFRAWKTELFPTAPFRSLQPGEASQVLAPLSTRVLVDRRKLLALGIPQCSLAGTAWMILFWKAAAAGWRSYSLGQNTPRKLLEQPDYPMQDTGFMLRFLTDAGLRALGPREPDLGRGSIAFPTSRPAHASTSRARLQVLVVSPFLPYPLSHGGAVRIYNLCRALAGRVDFILAAVRESEDVVDYARLGEVFREIYIIDKDERASGSTELPAQVREHQSRSLRALIAELARTHRPDLLQVEYTHMAGMRDAAPEIPAILVEHDLTFSLYRQLAGKEDAGNAAQLEYQRWLQFETHWLSAYDAVWTVSSDDCAAAEKQGNRKPGTTFAVANGVDVGRFVPREEPTVTPEIFYVGSFRHLPNILGFTKLRDEVMPRLWSRFPDVRLRVVAGPQHELFWKRFARTGDAPEFDSRIQIHGFVEDLRPLYASATLVVVPLEVSAGTNIKVLEAMACGKAVVTTPIGCAGLGLRNRDDIWIDDTWEGFANSIGELLSDAALRGQVAARARRTVEDRFSWTAIANLAYQTYLAVAGAPVP